MVQDESITPRELLAELLPSAPAFSATRVIGGKLRALYDDAAVPWPTDLIELLGALDADDQAAH
jgi:hypothetical protein